MSSGDCMGKNGDLHAPVTVPRVVTEDGEAWLWCGLATDSSVSIADEPEDVTCVECIESIRFAEKTLSYQVSRMQWVEDSGEKSWFGKTIIEKPGVAYRFVKNYLDYED